MSPSRAAEQEGNGADLQALDLLFAASVHILALALVLMAGLWHRPREFHPQSVQVRLISARQLKSMQHHAPARRKKHHQKIERKHRTPSVAPHVMHKSPRQPKPPSPKAKQARTHAHAAKSEPDFDPFKPLASTSDVHSSAPVKSKPAADVFAGQLSKQEINRYIALIQQAVQSHWKVPTAVGDVRDPLVEMNLNPDGGIASVQVRESSGSPALDASLIRAIRAAAPFRIPARQFEAFRHNLIRFRPLR